MSAARSLTLKLYFLSYRLFRFVNRGAKRLLLILKSCLVSFWLAVLDRRHFHGIDERHYNRDRMYTDEDYNLRGLWPWEERLVNQYFGGCKTLLVSSAGGGREVVALRRLGFDVDGFECNPRLLRYGNDLLARIGEPATLQPAPRDEVPDLAGSYDGLIVGWGSYTLIPGSHQRIAFLRRLRQHASGDGAPILLSFFARSPRARYFKMIAGGANLLRRRLGRELVEVGDVLDPNYVHYFTENELRAELRAAGFRAELFSTEGYGHAVGTAV